MYFLMLKRNALAWYAACTRVGTLKTVHKEVSSSIATMSFSHRPWSSSSSDNALVSGTNSKTAKKPTTLKFAMSISGISKRISQLTSTQHTSRRPLWDYYLSNERDSSQYKPTLRLESPEQGGGMWSRWRNYYNPLSCLILIVKGSNLQEPKRSGGKTHSDVSHVKGECFSWILRTPQNMATAIMRRNKLWMELVLPPGSKPFRKDRYQEWLRLDEPGMFRVSNSKIF